jgi:hypothetical protein
VLAQQSALRDNGLDHCKQTSARPGEGSTARSEMWPSEGNIMKEPDHNSEDAVKRAALRSIHDRQPQTPALSQLRTPCKICRSSSPVPSNGTPESPSLKSKPTSGSQLSRGEGTQTVASQLGAE